MKIKIFLTLFIISVVSFIFISYKKIFFYIGFNEYIEINDTKYVLNNSNLFTIRKPLQYKNRLFYPSYEYSEYDNDNSIVYINGMYTRENFAYPLLQECVIDSIVMVIDPYIEINSYGGYNSILLEKFTIEQNITMNDLCIDMFKPINDIKKSDINEEHTLFFSFYIYNYLVFKPYVSLCLIDDTLYIKFSSVDKIYYQVNYKYCDKWIKLFNKNKEIITNKNG